MDEKKKILLFGGLITTFALATTIIVSIPMAVHTWDVVIEFWGW